MKKWSGTDSEYAKTHTITEEVEVYCSECGSGIPFRVDQTHCLTITVHPHTCPQGEKGE